MILCVGLGARFLGGIEDKDMFPVRGQTVLLRAPWIKNMLEFHDIQELPVYIFPRKSGEVSLLTYRIICYVYYCLGYRRWYFSS